MISFFLKNITKTTFFYSGLKGKTSSDISVTPFLFCNRNNFYILDILLYLNNFKRILFFLELLFLKKNNIFILYENQINLLELFNKKFMLLNKYIKSFNKIENKKVLKYNFKFIFLNMFLNDLYSFSNYKFFDSFKFYSKSLKFFKSRKYRNKLIESNTVFSKLKNDFFKLTYKYNKNKLIKRKYYYLFKNNNIKYLFFKILFLLDFFRIKLKEEQFLLGEKEDFFILLKFFSFNSYSINLKNNLNLFKNVILIYKFNFLKNYLALSNKVKKDYLIFSKKRFLKRKKLFSTRHILFVYRRILAIKFYLRVRLNFLKYDIKSNSKKLIKGKSKFLNSDLKSNLLKNIKKLEKLYIFFKIFGEKIRNFKEHVLKSSVSFRKKGLSRKKLVFFYTDYWQSGSLTNFYGVKNSFSSMTKVIPNFFLLIYINNSENFMKEVSNLSLPVIGFFDISKNLDFSQYNLLTNTLDFDLNYFYFNIVLESYLRSSLLELNNFHI
jgi:hypothetical protein